MSAFIVNPEHIAALANYCLDPCNKVWIFNGYTKKKVFDFTHPGLADKQKNEAKFIAQTLAKANVKSCHKLYKNNDEQYRADYLAELMLFPSECSKAMDKIKHKFLSHADIYNMACCLEYQSCEVDNWISKDAYWIIKAIKDAAGKGMAWDAKVKWEWKAA
jgi:hypothetical protein